MVEGSFTAEDHVWGLCCLGVENADTYRNLGRIGELEEWVGLTCDGKHLCATFHDDRTVFDLLFVLAHDLKALLHSVNNGCAIRV